MAGKKRAEMEIEELNLIPIMNMVMILIPLLLLSVVFVQVGVIDIFAPKQSTGPKESQNTDEEQKRLRILITHDGFHLFKNNMPLTPLPGCQTGQNAPTVCLKPGQAEHEIERYDWRELYNQLVGIKREAGWDEITQLEMVADPDIPFFILTAAMDTSRCELEKDAFTDDASYFAAEANLVEKTVVDEETGKKRLTSVCKDNLFPDVILALIQ